MTYGPNIFIIVMPMADWNQLCNIYTGRPENVPAMEDLTGRMGSRFGAAQSCLDRRPHQPDRFGQVAASIGQVRAEHQNAVIETVE
jgi:hypothetical protein